VLVYPSAGELAWLVEEQGPVHIAHQILLVNRKISQMSSMAFSHGFTRLGEVATATKPKSQSAQQNTQNRQNRNIFHHFSFCKPITRPRFSGKVILDITHHGGSFAYKPKIIISVGGRAVNAKKSRLYRFLSVVVKKASCGCKGRFFRTISPSITRRYK